MFIQVEISTHCNFTCFYCAGRDMEQRYMSLEFFDGIMDRLPPGDHVVCLQGEGEPMVHPDFWAMVERVRSRGHTPYTITNGSRIDAAKVARAFPKIAVSLDTLDPAEAERIGRKKLDKVLRNVDHLLEHMGPRRVVITTVDYGQPLDTLKAHIRGKGIEEHMIQPLQVKEDYRRRYPDFPAPEENYTYRCRYLENPLHRTYDLDGHVFPCCYIKNASGFESIESLRESMDSHVVPPCCRGCREILVDVAQPVWLSNRLPPVISIIIPVKGRLRQLKHAVPCLFTQPSCELIVVDYGCPDGSGDWAARAYPGISVVKVGQAPVLNVSHARNLGASAAQGRWLCFLDADTLLAPEFATAALPILELGGFALFAPDTPGLVICPQEAFRQIGGYDETFQGWGCEDDDLIARLRLAGNTERPLPAGLFSLQAHSDADRTAHYEIADKWLSLRINGMYFQIKTDLARALGVVSLPREQLRSIYEEIRRTILSAPSSPAEIRITLPAQTDFRQPPGWRLGREWVYRYEPAAPTAPGVSS